MSKESEKGAVYRQLATAASLKAIQLSMLGTKVESERKLMKAMSEYFDEQADICFDNAHFEFDLDL